MSEWRLYTYDEDEAQKNGKPPVEPPEEAELSADGAWATLYGGDPHRIIAVWLRQHRPDADPEDVELRKAAIRRARLDADRATG